MSIKMKKVLLIALLLMVSTVSQAQTKITVRNTHGVMSTDPLADFAAGDVRLSCVSFACGTRDGNYKSDFRRYYKDENWERLADFVMRYGTVMNRNYFYLGAASEGFGRKQQALIYYQLALIEPIRCIPVLGTCSGIRVRKESKVKIAMLKAELAASGGSAVNDSTQVDSRGSIIVANNGETNNPVPVKVVPEVKPLSFQGVGKWETSVKADPITDEQVISSILLSNDYKATYKNQTALIVRCDNGKVDIYTAFDDYLGSDSITVVSRVDKDKPKKGSWGLSTNNQSAFYSGNKKDLLRRLFSAEQYVVRATPYNENPKTLIFDVKGIFNALEPHKDICKW